MAVFKELRTLDEHSEIHFWSDKKFGKAARAIFAEYDDNVPVRLIMAGRFRRYNSLSKWHLLRPSIFFPNLADLFRVMLGFFQSLYGLIVWRPDVIFMKGGYVCLPVGYAARLLRIPMVLHDSDAHPGLTNRLLAPYAEMIGTGAPLEYYPYKDGKAKHVGIPVSSEFRKYSAQERKVFKEELGLDTTKPLLVVTGGGLGAVRINNAVIAERANLQELASVFLISGTQQYDELRESAPENDSHWRLEAFIHQDMWRILAAADVVVTRAGATTLAELASLHKPSVIVPNKLLTAGHQLKNAKVYQDNLAAVILAEDELVQNSGVLTSKLTQILKAPQILADLGENFGKFAKPDAARDMAKIIFEVAKKEQ